MLPAPSSLAESIIAAFRTNDRITQYLVGHIAPEVWHERPPDGGRSISSMVAHIHNVRRFWIKVLGRKLHMAVPEKLDRETVTPAQASLALDTSRDGIAAILKVSVDTDGQISEFPPDVVHYLGYLIAHEAHHRGQISMQARQLGYALPERVMYELWSWPKHAEAAKE
jgi:uncharacterized damage-inducible protein DinB